MFTILSFVIKVLSFIILISSKSVFRFCLDRDSVAGYPLKGSISPLSRPVGAVRVRTGQVAGQVVEPPTLDDPEVPHSHRLDTCSTPKNHHNTTWPPLGKQMATHVSHRTSFLLPPPNSVPSLHSTAPT